MLAELQRLLRDAELLAFEAGCEDYCERDVDELRGELKAVYQIAKDSTTPGIASGAAAISVRSQGTPAALQRSRSRLQQAVYCSCRLTSPQQQRPSGEPWGRASQRGSGGCNPPA
jgi:hypothetical protein